MIVRVRVLRHEVVDPSGDRKRTLRVFCPVQERSIALASCDGCPRLREAIVEADGGQIGCEVDVPVDGAPALDSAASGEDVPACALTVVELADGVAVGEAMASHVVCLDHDTSVRLAQQALAAEGAPALPVISAEGELLGVVQRRRVAAIPPVLLPISAAGVIDPAAPALHEAEPLRAAIAAMTTERARWLPVVNASGELVGAISDLDLLRWLARARG